LGVIWRYVALSGVIERYAVMGKSGVRSKIAAKKAQEVEEQAALKAEVEGQQTNGNTPPTVFHGA
jgi:hypothetical protein